MRRLILFIVLFCQLAFTQAQVLVHEEPRHHPVFQNEKIRILNVLLPPGDTTQYHVHHTPSLFLFFTSTTTGSQLQNAAASTGRSSGGTLLFENLAAPHLRVHRVWNMDADTFHVMDIELLSKDSGFAQKPLTLPHLQLAIDTAWARVYNLRLESQTDFVLQKLSRSLLLVSMDSTTVRRQQGGKTALQTLQPGSFYWLNAGQAFGLKNTGRTAGRFALVEVPGLF
jgi:hypothetical protein